MTEFQPNNIEPRDENTLTPGSMEESFTADGMRRTLDGTWNPEDPEWEEAYEAHRLLLEAGLTKPAVNLDNVRRATSEINEARKLVDNVFEEQNDSDKDS